MVDFGWWILLRALQLRRDKVAGEGSGDFGFWIVNFGWWIAAQILDEQRMKNHFNES